MTLGRRFGHRIPLGLAVAGLAIGAFGTALALAARGASVGASTLSVCGSSTLLLPGSSGSCRETFASPYGTQPVAVSLAISTVSTSGGGQPQSGLATEALLDGTKTGLQVQIIDDSSGKLFLVMNVYCYAGAGSSDRALYPDAAYCTSHQSGMPVGDFRARGDHSQTFTVRWLLPTGAGNVYQGGGATVTVEPTFTDLSAGSPGGGVLGQSTGSPPPPVGPGGGVLGAHTPSTGAGLLVGLSRAIIGLGLTLLLLGLWGWRRWGDSAEREGSG